MAQYTEPNGFKGTPGEWKLAWSDRIHASPKQGLVVSRLSVCNVLDFGGDEYAKANTNLLLQAKELAKALQLLVNQVETGGDYHPAMMYAKEILDKAIPNK